VSVKISRSANQQRPFPVSGQSQDATGTNAGDPRPQASGLASAGSNSTGGPLLVGGAILLAVLFPPILVLYIVLGVLAAMSSKK
jgi:hypothetical protein